MNFVFEKVSNDGVHLNFVNCKDVLTTGFRRFTPCPSSLTMIRFRASAHAIFKNFAKNIVVLDTPPSNQKYIISSGVSHSPDDWCGVDYLGVGVSKYHPSTNTLFSFLNKQYLADLQSGKAFLLLDQSHEGYQTEWLWSWFHNNCDFYKINPKQIIYLTGNLDCTVQYTQWADNHNLENRILTIGYPHFELMVYDTMETLNYYTAGNSKKTPLFKDHIKYKQDNLQNIKTFNALQKRTRGHRIWFFKALNDAGLVNTNIISMNKFNFHGCYYEGRWLDEKDFNILDSLTPVMPRENPKDYSLLNFSDHDCGQYLAAFNEQTMLDTWLTVVSEASFGDLEHTCFISEKTFKPIACCHPFIIVGNKGSLANLRKLGYRTFHPFIDESYDTLDTWERMTAITTELQRLDKLSPSEKLAWFKNLQDILEHNYNTLCANSSTIVPPAFQIVRTYALSTN